MKRQIVEVLDEWTLLGMHRKAIQIALRLLEHRFGKLTPELRHTVEQLSDDSLDELAPAAIDFTTLAEAESWIAQRR